MLEQPLPQVTVVPPRHGDEAIVLVQDHDLLESHIHDPLEQVTIALPEYWVLLFGIGIE
jgi:hypothetical protein